MVDWPGGDGIMARRIRDHDWRATPLGSTLQWPAALRSIVSTALDSPMPMAVAWGRNLTTLYNDAFQALLGGNDGLGRDISSVWAAAREPIALPLKRVLSGHAVKIEDVSFVISRGGRSEESVFDCFLTPLRDDVGTIRGVLHLAIEGTKTSLRENDTRHRLLIDSWAQAVWETDANGLITVDSPSWRAYTGQTLEEWLGYGWLDAIHPKDRAYAEAQWLEAVELRRHVDAEFRVRAADGSWRWTNVRAAPVMDASGQVEKWIGMNIDIELRKRAEAALKESEKRYRSLFTSMDEAYAVVELLKDGTGRWCDFRFVEVNPAFMVHTSMPWPVGRTATQLLGHPNPLWTQLYGQVLDSGKAIRVEEGEPTLQRIFDLNIFPLEPERARVAVLFTDVTDRKRAEGLLREAQERQSFLLSLSDALRGEPDAEAIAQTAVEMVAAHLQLDRCYIANMDPATDIGRIDTEFRHADLPSIAGDHRYSEAPKAIRRPDTACVIVPNTRNALSFSQSETEKLLSMDIGALLCVPHRWNGHDKVWTFNAATVAARDWTLGDQRLVEAAAERTWAALEKSRAEASLRDREERQAFLLKLSDAMRAQDTSVAMARTALTLLAEHLDLDRAYIAQIDKDRDQAKIDPEFRRQNMAPVEGVLTLSDFPQAWARVEVETLVLNDTAADSDLAPSDKQGFASLQMGAVVVASARREPRLPAWALLVASENPRRWTTSEVALVEDVAERIWAAVKRAEAEDSLRDGEERLRLIFESAQDYAIFSMDVERRVVEWPPGAEAVFGWKRVEIEGKSADVLFTPEDRLDHIPESETEIAVRDGAAPDVRWHLHKDGHRVFIEGQTVPLYKAGQHSGFLKIGQDVTDRRAAERSLRESEERYAFLLKLTDALRHFDKASDIERTAIELLGRALNASRVFYATMGSDGLSWSVSHDYADGLPSTVGTFPVSEFQRRRLSGWTAGRVSRTADCETDPKLDDVDRAAYAAVQARAAIGVPLVRAGRLTALLAVNHVEARQWTDAEVALTRETAERVWTSIERARAEASLRESEERKAFQLALSDGLHVLTDPSEITQTAADLLRQYLGVTEVQFNEEGENGEYLDSDGGYTDAAPAGIPSPALELLNQGSYPLGKTVVVTDISRDARTQSVAWSAGANGDVQAFVSVPLVTDKRFAGTLTVVQGSARDWTDGDVTVTQETAERTWAAVRRARAEAALRDREAELARVQEIGRVAGIDIDLTDNMSTPRRSPEYRRVHGLASDVISETHEEWLARLHPDDREGADRALRHAIAEGRSRYENEYRIIRPSDGQTRWISAKGAIERDKEGRPLRMIGAHIDITERKDAETALRESEERLSLAIGVGELATWDWDIRTGNVVWSELHYQMAGYAPSEVVPSYAAWAARVHPDDLAETEASLQASRESRQTYRHNFRSLHPDGSVHWLSAHGWYFYGEDGQATRMIGAMRDVSAERDAMAALQESRERWQHLADAIPNLVWIGEAGTGIITYVNGLFRDYTGLDVAALANEGWLQILHPDDQETVQAAWSDSRQTGREFDTEFRLRHRDGEYRWFQGRAVRAPDRDGENDLWFGACADIQNLMEARFEAESADRAKSEFLANMSHEIRTPLNAVVGLTSIMLELDGDNSRHPEYLRTMQASARHLTGLINDVLEYARIDADMVELHESELDLRALLEEVVRISAVKAQEKQLQVELHDHSLSQRFIADGQRIKQILLNLLSNAIKFTERGGVTVTVVDAKAQGARHVVSILVKDTGIGIAAENLEMIFEKFTQADNTITRRFGGTGLGLAISRRLAETMGGELKVRSQVDKGSEFALTLPLRTTSNGETPARMRSDIGTENQLQVLVVEDNPTNVLVAETMLKKMGHSFISAGNGFEALDAWRQGSFDVVLMDLQMPDMDGITAAKRIRQLERSFDRPRARIIAMTAHALNSDRERAIAAGMDAFLAKPFTADELRRVLAREHS